MKGKSFETKVSDLLNHLGADSIDFEGKSTELLPNLTEEGMGGTLDFHSIDGESVLVTLQDFSCSVIETCDICGAEFERAVFVPEYIAKFTLDPKELQESSDEVLFLIDAKSDTINVEDMLYQAAKLDEPFVKRCPICEKNLSTEEEEDFDENTTES